MSEHKMSTEEIKQLLLLNCCGNILSDTPAKMWRTLTDAQKDAISAAAKVVCDTARELIGTERDPDRAEMILRRMKTLHVNVDHVKHPVEEIIPVHREELELYLYPTLQKCTLECPCVQLDADGNEIVDLVAVKQCETARAFRRDGLSELGIGACPYWGG